MSYLQTTDDLRTDALWRAGEPQTSSSAFWSKSLDYLNRIQMNLLMGGAVAVGRDLATSAGIYAHMVNLPITDWWWARKRAVFNTEAAQLRTDVTISQGTKVCSVTTGIDTNLTGWYVFVDGRATVPRIAKHTPGSLLLTLDAEWPETSVSDGRAYLAKLEYDLPSDFLRFTSPPYAHTLFGSTLDVGSNEQRDADWPLSVNRRGRPTRAFMSGPRSLTLNGYDDRAYRIEFEYVAAPNTLTVGSLPVLPPHHRMVLSTGAAMLIAFDKNDGKAEQLASEFRELVSRMVQEHRRAISGGSSTFGAFRVRQPGIRVRSPQSFGELFLA